MRIALMTNNYLPFVGGVSISIARLAEGLRKEGHEVVIFAPSYKGCKKDENIVRYTSLHTNICGGISLPIPIDPKVEAVFKERVFDMIHVHHPMLIGKVAAHLSAKYNIPLVYTYHTRYEQYAHYVLPGKLISSVKTMNITEKLINRYMEQFLKRCDHVFVPTRGMEEYPVQRCHYDNEQISVLPTGLSENSFAVDKRKTQAIRNRFDAQHCPLFISVSRLGKEKNISFLLQSIKSFKEKYQKPFKLLLVGEGPDKEMLIDMVKTLDINEEVIFTGKIPNAELKDYYGASDAFVFASKSETQGIVLLEAFAAGTPAVCVEASGISDLLKDGENGFLVSENAFLFAEQLYKLTTENALREILSDGARRTARSFSENHIAKEAIGQYNKIIAEHAFCKYEKRNEEQWKINIEF